MVDQQITTFFNKVYDDTYERILTYVTAKCGNTEDISDIMQEIYLEVYSVFLKKGTDYVKNTDAFVYSVAKSKVYKHYTFAERLKRLIPMFSKNEDDEEVNIVDFNIADMRLEEDIANKWLFERIASYIAAKPDVVRRIFYLFYYCDLSIAQIAKKLSMSESGVKNKLYRTVRELRELYGKGSADHD
ncbi:MAG TPA: sigma-70 family RNA polymerase sigma factor [Bacillota bacterium]|nr:sigma-70 family RNA polymerase sigma factor [Bacillota bacterium]HOK69328.1 sigma-70 family RNA polymerase sigma factor [Bacillota bacterium]HPP85317.1 sigma-70 family RNA polymerase sigma factor [Bacillota bacterium]